jgi:predicted Fe-S protein YdhL (DUF1289 family)
MTTTTAPLTPCIKLCVLDPRSDHCLGCGRTRHEIGLWSSLDNDRRRRIMAELPARLQRLRGGASSSPEPSAPDAAS